MDELARSPGRHGYSRGVISGETLTGRDSELRLIRRALGGAGNHSGVVIAGAAGVGKTWLAREALRRGYSGVALKDESPALARLDVAESQRGIA